MAIFGTVTLEDISIDWRVIQRSPNDLGPDLVCVTVVDTFSGAEETYTTNAPGFMVALGAALNFDGVATDQDAAEQAQPTNPALRFIP